MPERLLQEQRDAMDEQQVDLAREIMRLCHVYRNRMGKPPFVWIENNETGEFLVYTLGDMREPIKEALSKL